MPPASLPCAFDASCRARLGNAGGFRQNSIALCTKENAGQRGHGRHRHRRRRHRRQRDRLFSEHGCRRVGPAHRPDRARRRLRHRQHRPLGRRRAAQFSTPENIAMSQFTLSVFRSLKAMFGADADVGFREQGYLLLATPETQRDPRRERRPAAVGGRRYRVARWRRLAQRFPWLVDGRGRRRRLWPVGRGLVRSAQPRRAVPQGGAAARRHRAL